MLSLSVRQCWHAHPERSFDTCKRLWKEFKRTFTTLSGEAPSRPWALPVRRKSLTVARTLDGEGLQHLKQVVDENPRLFLDEIALKLKNERGSMMSEASVCRYLMASTSAV